MPDFCFGYNIQNCNAVMRMLDLEDAGVSCHGMDRGMFKQIWDQLVSVLAIWAVSVFALMFFHEDVGIDPQHLPMMIFGSLPVFAAGSVVVSLARQFMSKNGVS